MLEEAGLNGWGLFNLFILLLGNLSGFVEEGRDGGMADTQLRNEGKGNSTP